jgi:ABC-type dipeptide/oligopeptide/nickel transport system permease component
MGQLIFRRFLWMLLVLFVISFITFFLMHSVPGGPFDRERPLPTETRKALEEMYRLDLPMWQQYLYYVSDLAIPRIVVGKQRPSSAQDFIINIPLPSQFFNGEEAFIKWMNFGPSFRSSTRSVVDIFADNFDVSAQLGIAAMLVAITIGLPLGIISALNRNNAVDYVAMAIAILGVSVPVIVSAPVLQYIVAVQWGLVDPTGWGEFQDMILPSFVLGFVNAALIARLTRASLLQVLHEDYIRTARAKGLSQQRVILIHAMKNSLIPVVTILGPLFANLLTGTFVVETTFGIPGMGKYFVSSIVNRDYTVIMGTTLLYAFILVLANLMVDITYAWIDPRIRYR